MLLVCDGAGVLVDDCGGGAAGVVGGAAGVGVAVVHRRLGPRPPPRAGRPLLDLQATFPQQSGESKGYLSYTYSQGDLQPSVFFAKQNVLLNPG